MKLCKFTPCWDVIIRGDCIPKLFFFFLLFFFKPLVSAKCSDSQLKACNVHPCKLIGPGLLASHCHPALMGRTQMKSHLVHRRQLAKAQITSSLNNRIHTTEDPPGYEEPGGCEPLSVKRDLVSVNLKGGGGMQSVLYFQTSLANPGQASGMQSLPGVMSALCRSYC